MEWYFKLKRSTFVYIEGFYNPKRPPSADNNLSPDKKKDMLKKTDRAHIMISSLIPSFFLTRIQPENRQIAEATRRLPHPHLLMNQGPW